MSEPQNELVLSLPAWLKAALAEICRQKLITPQEYVRTLILQEAKRLVPSKVPLGADVIDYDSPVVKLAHSILSHSAEQGASEAIFVNNVDRYSVMLTKGSRQDLLLDIPPHVAPMVFGTLKEMARCWMERTNARGGLCFTCRIQNDENREYSFLISDGDTTQGELGRMRIVRLPLNDKV